MRLRLCPPSVIIMTVMILFSFTAYGADAPHELTLAQALSHTRDHSPALAAARAELDVTRELYPQARAGWKPLLDAEASLYHSDIDNSNFGNADGTTTKDISFNLQQPLFRSGRTAAQTARAQALIRAAESQYKRMEQDILLSAAQAYINILSDRKLYTIQADNESFLSTERQATHEKLEAGLLTVTDLRQAEARLARARAQTLYASGRLESAYAAFERITGLKPVHVFFYPADIGLMAPYDALRAQASHDNPDIIAAQYAHEAADHNIDASLREHFPQILAFLSYNKQYDPQPGIIDDSETRTIGIRAAIPLYDAGMTASRTRQARSTARQRAQEIDDTRRRIDAALQAEWKNREAALSEMTARRLEIEAAELAREGVQAEARLGERTVLDILDADQDLLSSQAALIEARRSELLSRYRIYALLGRLPAI